MEKVTQLPENVFAHLLKLVDDQTVALERMVSEKTQFLTEESRKVDDLLAEMLPR